MQHPILAPLEGGAAPSVESWEARAEYDIGVLIARYLAEHPSPSESQVHRDFLSWSAALRCDGQARLQEQGETPLQVAR